MRVSNCSCGWAIHKMRGGKAYPLACQAQRPVAGWHDTAATLDSYSSGEGLGTFLRPGGAKALVAENILLKHRIMILHRSCCRASHLGFSDRLLFGLVSLFLSPRRLAHSADVVNPRLS